MPTVDIQQVCFNGHRTTGTIRRSPEKMSEFCTQCGEATIIACPNCAMAIPGNVYYEGAGFGYNETPSVPAYCRSCGKPFPWTERRRENFRELAAELTDLSDEDRRILDTSLDEIVKNSPRAEVASLQFKKVMRKVGKESYTLLRSVATDLISETLQKIIFGT